MLFLFVHIIDPFEYDGFPHSRLRSVDENNATQLMGGVCWVLGLDGLGGVGSGVTCPVPGLWSMALQLKSPVVAPCLQLILCVYV